MKYELKSKQFEVTISDANGKELVHVCGSIHLRTNIAALIASVTSMLTGEMTQEEPKPEEPKQEEPKQEEPKQEEPKQEEPKQEGSRVSVQDILRYRLNGVLKNDTGLPQAMRVGDALVFHNGTLSPHVIDDILRAVNDAKQF